MEECYSLSQRSALHGVKLKDISVSNRRYVMI